MKPVNADCCPKKGVVTIKCQDTDKKIVLICMDGTTASPLGYCGNGDCNVFGCNCDGGCRSNPSNTFEEAVKLTGEKLGCEIVNYRRI